MGFPVPTAIFDTAPDIRGHRGPKLVPIPYNMAVEVGCEVYTPGSCELFFKLVGRPRVAGYPVPRG